MPNNKQTNQTNRLGILFIKSLRRKNTERNTKVNEKQKQKKIFNNIEENPMDFQLVFFRIAKQSNSSSLSKDSFNILLFFGWKKNRSIWSRYDLWPNFEKTHLISSSSSSISHTQTRKFKVGDLCFNQFIITNKHHL